MGHEPGAGALDFLDEELAQLSSKQLLRSAEVVAPGLTVLCSNDYLGFGARPLATGPAAGGAGASPLVVGYRDEHRRAETALAAWLGRPSALLFSSGYAANVGAVSALVGRGDLVVSDALNHASIIDGCRLSGAQIAVVPHLDVDAIATVLQKNREFRRRLVVTESYFSMDADGPDLGRLAALCAEHRAIFYVDEAHALGLEGPEGRGRAAAAGVVPDVTVGTLGKALGLHGAFVAGSAQLRGYLWNRARSLVFSTGISPAVAAAVVERIGWVRSGDRTRSGLAALSARVRGELRSQGWDLRGAGPIVPIVVGAADRALALSAGLRDAGLVVQAIRPPTVADGTARLRLTLTAGLGDEVVDHLLQTLARLRPLVA